MNLIDKSDIQWLINKHQSDYYYKSFKTWTHLLTMLFGILSRAIVDEVQGIASLKPVIDEPTLQWLAEQAGFMAI